MTARIVLGISGSIAAFKGAALASEMVKAGWEVRSVLTPGAARFVTPLTFEALTGHPAGVDVWDEAGSSRMGHLDLARWADAMVVAPASAGAIARLALGLTSDLLGAVALACRAPLVVAPAMESAMFEHPATQGHLATLCQRGATVVGPERGRLASGAEGLGRMSEPAEIMRALRAVLHEGDFAGRRVLVTAGPTHEAIDRVRFVGNRSSGKMGYALAAEAAVRGAQVILVSGPVSLRVPAGITGIQVESASEMRDAVLAHAAGMDALIMAAAVADFRPAAAAEGKLKRHEGLHLDLVPTDDIAAAAFSAAPHAVKVAFALEAEDLIGAARRKLDSKGADLVVANVISDEHNPFGNDRNQVALVTADGVEELPNQDKRVVAKVIMDRVRGLTGAG